MSDVGGTETSSDKKQVIEVISKRRERQARNKERLVAREEVNILRAQLRDCAQREYINRIQNCQEEAKAYLDAFRKYRDGELILGAFYFNYVQFTFTEYGF